MEVLQTTEITPDLILEAVCNEYNITQEQIKGISRKRTLSDARKIGMFLMRKNDPLLTLKKTGEIFGGRHHTSVIFLIEECEFLCKTNKYFKKKYNHVLQYLNL